MSPDKLTEMRASRCACVKLSQHVRRKNGQRTPTQPTKGHMHDQAITRVSHPCGSRRSALQLTRAPVATEQDDAHTHACAHVPYEHTEHRDIIPFQTHYPSTSRFRLQAVDQRVMRCMLRCVWGSDMCRCSFPPYLATHRYTTRSTHRKSFRTRAWRRS